MEEDPNDIKEDSDRLMKDISRLESMHSKEKEEWKGTMVEVIKEKDMNISILENKNDKLLAEIGKLQRKIEEIETQKETVLKEHKKMEEKIEKLGTMNKELKNLNFRIRKYNDNVAVRVEYVLVKFVYPYVIPYTIIYNKIIEIVRALLLVDWRI